MISLSLAKRLKEAGLVWQADDNAYGLIFLHLLKPYEQEHDDR